jgi:hypothetical protein
MSHENEPGGRGDDPGDTGGQKIGIRCGDLETAPHAAWAARAL